MTVTTIFTPTFNRAHPLPTLYRSLLEQTRRDFEWLVVDDGSTDDTPALLAGWEAEGRLAMRVIRTSNGGKHRAINRAAREARGELFFIVDSDDYLTPDAIEQITEHWEAARSNPATGGLCFLKLNYNTGEPVSGRTAVPTGDYSSIEIAFRLGLTGDKAEVFRTTVIQEYPFPEFADENFVPEALVWRRIAARYKLRFVNKGIYMCEYMPDGLSRNFSTNLKRNPTGFSTLYREALGYAGIPFPKKLKALVRYAQCMIYKYLQKR